MSYTHQKPPQCSGCPAERLGKGYVPAEGPTDAKAAFVGQGPGEQEAEFGRPFFPEAPAGARLTKWMHRSGWQRTEVFIDNIVRCWLPGNREPTEPEVRHCWNAYVGPALHEWSQKNRDRQHHLFAIGMPAARALIGPHVGERYAGSTCPIELPSVGDNP